MTIGRNAVGIQVSADPRDSGGFEVAAAADRNRRRGPADG